jgi:hypothetical protein
MAAKGTTDILVFINRPGFLSVVSKPRIAWASMATSDETAARIEK